MLEPERLLFDDPALRERYSLVARIGSGAYGRVFEAVQCSTGQRVAVKVLRPPEGRNEAVFEHDAERFRRETHLCAQLHHPNIVRLIDSGEVANMLFAVFELVPGNNLADVIAEEGALEPAEAVHLMLQVLDALSCSHRLGIVHRDLKPANIMVTTTGARRNALVLDFGLGVFAQEGGRVLDRRLTHAGEYLGTPLYSAPEQLCGMPPTVRSDIYAWGLTFIECLTGTPAVAGTTAAEVVHHQLSRRSVPVPPAIERHPLARLLRSALVKQPAESRAAADELLRELLAIPLASLPSREGMRVRREKGRDSAPLAPDAGPIWQVPLQRNVNFTGRELLLNTLRQALLADPPPAVVALHGLGGIGKTQIALEYAYRHERDYEFVAWVRAEGVDTLAADYASLAEALDLPERDTPDQYAKIEAVRRWLERHRGWLLVFDNAPTPEAIRPYLPHSPAGHVVATSREQSWRRLGVGIGVDVLEPDEATAFLTARSGDPHAPEALSLCEDLGRLPLALEEAAAYIEATGRSISTYRRLLESNRLRLLVEGTPPINYPWTVRSTWELSLKRLEAEASTAAHLLCLCAYLAPDDVPLAELRQGLARIGEGPLAPLHDEIELDRSIAALRRYSLVKLSESSLSLHRLVQLVTRDRLPEEERARWAEIALHVIESVYPRNGLAGDIRPESGRLLPHALAALGHVEHLRQCDERAAQLLCRTGVYLSATGVHTRAIEHLTKAVRIFDDNPDFGDRERGAVLANLAMVQNARGELHEARDLLQRAAAIHTRLDGAEALSVGLDLVTLSWVERALGEPQEACAAAERATGIVGPALGDRHPIIATVQSVRARALWELGEIEPAARLVDDVLEMLDGARTRFHPMTSGAWSYVAQLSLELGEVERAFACAALGAEVALPGYGSDHPLVLANLIVSGRVLLERGDHEGARALFERVLNGSRRTCSRPHADLAPAQPLLAETLRRAGEPAAARRVLEQALATAAAVAGDRSRPLAGVYMVSGNLLADQGDFAAASVEQTKACELMERRLGVSHPSLLPMVNALARTRLRAGASGEAHRLAERVLSIGRDHRLARHLEIAAAREVLADCELARGQTAAALQHLVLAAAIVGDRLGEQSDRHRKLAARTDALRA